jgi:septal ring factor EnvC (AmiA/AmiB activator)
MKDNLLDEQQKKNEELDTEYQEVADRYEELKNDKIGTEQAFEEVLERSADMRREVMLAVKNQTEARLRLEKFEEMNKEIIAKLK